VPINKPTSLKVDQNSYPNGAKTHRISDFGYPLPSLVAWWWRRRKPEHACSNIPRLDAGPGSASIDKPAHLFSGIAPEPLAFILSLGNRCLCCLPVQSFASLLSVWGLFYFSASLFAFFFHGSARLLELASSSFCSAARTTSAPHTETWPAKSSCTAILPNVSPGEQWCH
jgi:hypothetical protein